MEKIKIFETKRADTRALEKDFTINDVEIDTNYHKEAVHLACCAIADMLVSQSKKHDYTKLGAHLPAFYRALKSGFKDDKFENLNWYKMHCTEERHHLNKHCPDDVNLVDVIEMLCDCVTAGMARTGNVYDVEISNDILQKAVKNTVELLKQNIEVKKS